MHYNIGSLASLCKVCLYPGMSLLNVCKYIQKEKKVFPVVADACCSTNCDVKNKIH